MEDKKIKYPSQGFRVHPDTWTKFKEKKKESNLSWNLFILKLLNLTK